VISLSGGVSANSSLRSRAIQRATDEALEIHFPPPGLLTDNALMIAFAAAHHLASGNTDPVETEITPNFNPDALRRPA